MLYEGGIRAPFIARWPGKIQPGTTSDLLTTFVDFMPTAAELAGVSIPSGMDGISILPTLLGQKQTKLHDSLYFEIYEPYFQQSVRWGDWKGYRLGTKAPLELYDLKTDPTEKKNLSAAHPDIVQKIEAIMASEHTPSPHYDAPEQPQKDSKKPKKNKKVASLPEMMNEENSSPESGKK
jgi:arylsulfatase A-like enzyme